MAGIFAFAEAREGEIRKTAHEVVTAARRIADEMSEEVHAVVLGGSGVASGAEDLGRFGADRVFVGESDALARYSPEGYATVVADFIREHGCRVAIFPGSAMGKDLAPRVAARLGVGYAADCVGLEVEGGTLVASRPRYAGKVSARETFAGEPAVVSVRSNVFSPPRTRRAAGWRRSASR